MERGGGVHVGGRKRGERQADGNREDEGPASADSGRAHVDEEGEGARVNGRRTSPRR